MLPLALLALAYSLAGPRRYDGRGRRGLSRQALVLCAPRPLTPRQLNGRIANASTVDGILQLHAAHGDALDDINLSTCWSRLGRIAKNADRRRLLQDPALLAPLARQTAAALDDWGPWGVSATAHAAAKLRLEGGPYEALWSKLGTAAAASARDFNCQGLANTAWAFATAGRPEPALFDRLAAASEPRLSDFPSFALGQLLWAFAAAGAEAASLFDASAAELSAGRLKELSPQGVSMVAWAFATAGRPAPALFEAIADEAAPRLAEFAPQGLANLAWAFATVGEPSRSTSGGEAELFGLEFGRRCDAAADLFRREELTQLHVWCLWHSLECGQTEGMPSEGLRRRCHAEFTAQQGRPSRLQRHVGAALFRLVGSRPREEVTIPEGYSLDYLVEWRRAAPPHTTLTAHVAVTRPRHARCSGGALAWRSRWTGHRTTRPRARRRVRRSTVRCFVCAVFARPQSLALTLRLHE